MANYSSQQASPFIALENPCLTPCLAYVPIVMPYLGTPRALFLDRQNITHFLDLYDQLCLNYRISESEKINYRLKLYSKWFTQTAH